MHALRDGPGRATPRAPRPARAGIPLGRVGGIPLILSWSWLLSVVIIAVLATPVVQQVVSGIPTGQAIAVAAGLGVLLGLSVLVHELGHCLAARILGLPVVQVRLYLLGGVSELGRTPNSPREEAVIAAAGPGLSALLAGLFFLLVGSVPNRTIGWLLLVELALANAVVAVFNILPALPLDGGRVLRAGVWQLTGRRRWGTVAAAVGGYLIAVALVIWGTVQLTGSSQAGLLQGAIALGTAFFVLAGAVQEHRQDAGVSWPDGLPLASLARPVLQLPLEVPVSLALQASAGRPVLLTGADGVAAGLMDERAAAELSRMSPQAPASRVAVPVRPELVILPGDDPADVMDRLQGLPPGDLVLIDDTGTAVGVVPATEWSRILAGHPARGGPARPRGAAG